MKAYIEKLIRNKKKYYKADSNEMLGDYNREIDTVKGYNGRQLLELLQNCDDEGASEALIKLDKKAQTISISNNGNPFSKKGYRSLFISNLSSKTSKRKYIGNKGLGFRSIINWSNAIEIQSNNLSLKYDEDNRLKTFNYLFNKDIQEQIIKDEGLKKSVIPLPFLSIPKLSSIKQNQFVTTIIIQYKKEFLKDILQQVRNITQETLLFLRNLEIIKFEGFEVDITDIKTSKERININSNEFSPKEKISFNGSTWLIFEEEQLFETEIKSNKEEEEFYQIKIAIEENFQRSVPFLYSFFPTNIRLNQPYILHATFDLDPTRKQLDDTDKNIIILEKVVHFTIKVAKYFASEDVSYKPLEILNHKHKADTLNNLGYYELLKEAINSEAIFPCIDNTYKTLAESIYISDDFANMLQTVNAQNNIDIHLIPMNPHKLSDFEWGSDIDTKLSVLKDVDKVINNIAEREMDNNSRALFISQIVKEGEFITKKYTNKLNFLINNTLERKVIKGDEYIYTTITKDNELITPEYAKIQFIDKDLFEQLLIKFDFEEDENPNKGRFIYDKLKGFCNIHSYEPATLAQKIISETRIQIEDNPALSFQVIKEMNRCLFHNFMQFDDGTKLPEKVRIPTITKNKKIKFIDELMFSSFFLTGKITELIFEGIYTDDDYIESPSNLGLVTDNLDKIEEYLKWLGLNDFAVYKQETHENFGVNDYRDYIRTRYYSQHIYEARYKTTIYNIEKLPIILGKISIERLILWIHFDKRLHNQIDDQKNKDIYNYSFYGPNYISKKPSYIKFKINTLFPFDFQNYLIDEIYSWVNNYTVDYRKEFFLKNEVSKSLINAILILLGAKDNFNDLSINKVTDILNKLPEKYPNGKKTQTIYKKALSHFKENNLEIKRKIRLFADDGDGLKHFDQSEIYFSDRIKLPKKLKKKYPIFNFPSRSGGTDAIKFFGINDLKDVQIDLVNYVYIEELSDQFNSHLDDLKPLFLTYRIDINEDIKFKKIQASICKKITIVLCSEIKYKIDENIYHVADYEFLHHNEYTYYIKVKKEDTFNDVRLNSSFIDSCADIISLSFDVRGEHDSFRNLFRNEYREVLRDVKNNFGEDILQEARELLGLADYKQAFWQGVLAAKGIGYNEQLDDLALENLIKQQLNIDFDSSSIDYENINNEEEIIKVKFLFTDLDIELKDFAVHFLYSISLFKIHFNKIKNVILSKKNVIKSAIWKKLKNGYVNEQALYLSEINKFENYHDFAAHLAEYNEHTFDLNYVIAFEDFAKFLYGDLDLSEAIDITSIYNKNVFGFKDDDLHYIYQSERLKSLLYFEEALDTIKSEIPKHEDNYAQNTDGTSNGSTNCKPTITSSDNLRSKKEKSGTGKNGHNVFTPKETNQKKLKEKGDESEKIVFNYLRDNNFEGVDHVAKDNEGLHCDIRYTDENGIVKYIEVKTFDNSRFILTRSEYEFGKSEMDNYEIWLVRNKNEIIPIKDFFTNEKYKPIISEYEVYLDLINAEP